MGTLDKRYTSSSIVKMILSRLAFSAAVVAGQYADYYNNYADLDIDSIDKGFVFSSSDYTDDLGNKKNKNKNQQDFFGTAAKQQLDSGLANTCHGKSYAECASSGATAYCEGEQFHCFVAEKMHYGVVVQVEMGCKQDNACYREWSLNDRGYNGGNTMPDIAGFNFGQFATNTYKQCFPGNANQDVSICRQCCSTNNCNSGWKTSPLTSEAEWMATGAHDFSHINA